MSQPTTPPSVDTLPEAPQRGVKSTFVALAEAFVEALTPFRNQLVDLGDNVYDNAVIAYNSIELMEDYNEDSGTTTGLTWGYTSGEVRYDNVVTSSPAGTLSLTDNATNYIEVNSVGVLSSNTTGFSSGKLPLRVVITSGGAQVVSNDQRTWLTITSPWDGDISDIDLDAGTDIGGGLDDSDLILVDDGASGANRKSALSRVWTYIYSKSYTFLARLDGGGQVIQDTEFKNYYETVTSPSSSAGSLVLDLDNGNVFTTTLTENTTISMSNIPVTGKAAFFTIIIAQDGAGNWTLTWPASFDEGDGDISVETAANSKTMYTAMTVNGGTTWNISKCWSKA